MASIPSPIHPENLKAVNKIAEISGQNVHECMQCGTCSAVCPMAESMGFTTRMGIHYLQFGEIEPVIKARIGEFCASCQTCLVRCPRGIDVPKVFEAVRQYVLRTNTNLVNPAEISKETMGEAPQIAYVSTFRKLTS